MLQSQEPRFEATTVGAHLLPGLRKAPGMAEFNTHKEKLNWVYSILFFSKKILKITFK
jgi:hypothetical protein